MVRKNVVLLLLEEKGRDERAYQKVLFKFERREERRRRRNVR